ncbi:DUF2779 domain-containing protein [[Mycoplasma] testudinis]|uniref:DUF2779 domain-containing protein n=1 Tax=[Mycoplasma] testudinis TaxID=33924 RepID=UPI000481BF1C|nr:DUF2779 domain-containing protein [[Mycoplasma] testudinis]
MAIKKPLYITKQDYLNMFDRPDNLWFLTDEEIMGIINSYLYPVKTDSATVSQTNTNKNSVMNVIDNDDEEYEAVEFDVLDFVKDEVNEISVLDSNDPRVIEGRIVSEQAVEYLKRVASQTLKVVNIVDFDTLYKGIKSNIKERALLTKKVIEETNVPTLFLNPVFTYLNAVAIPDAIVFANNHYELYEVKGVTSSKRIHVLEMFYQAKIIKHTIDHLDDATLFLIAYELNQKGHVSFTRVQHLNCAKTAQTSLPKPKHKEDQKPFPYYGVETIKLKQELRKNPSSVISLHDLMSLDFVAMKKSASNPPSKKPENDLTPSVTKRSSPKAIEDLVEELLFLNARFEDDLAKLANHEVGASIKIELSDKYHTYWRIFRYRPLIQHVFEKQGFPIFSYSGKLIDWTSVFQFIYANKETTTNNANKYDLSSFLAWHQKIKNTPDPFHKTKKIKEINESMKTYLFTNNQAHDQSVDGIYCFYNAYDFYRTLKSKKVYFDFETLNQAIRVMDNSLPFMQVITQCSIVKDHGAGIANSECKNLIVDPINITNEFFKQVVDELYEENTDEYSYIVYNASFEKNRLIELKSILEDSDYSYKIDRIIRNLYDLADFFSLNKKNIVLRDLKGYYSIKVVLPIVPQKYLDQTRTVSYSTLEVRKGDKAQALTSLRFFNRIDDETWKTTEANLQKYCENDVRAMIAVEYYVAELLRRFEPYLTQQNDLAK